MSNAEMGRERRAGVLIHLPRPLIERLRADAEHTGLSLSREIERIVARNHETGNEKKEAS
jgi:hypothetical protein